MPKDISDTTPWTDERLRAAAHDIKNELASILALSEMLEVLLPTEAQPVAQPQIQKLRERILRTSETVTNTFKSLREERARSDSLRE